MQKILGYMRKAIDEYNMIEDGDKIAVALSGGKILLLYYLGLKICKDFILKNLILLELL